MMEKKVVFQIGSKKIYIVINTEQSNGRAETYLSAVCCGHSTYHDVVSTEPIVDLFDKALYKTLYDKSFVDEVNEAIIKRIPVTLSWYRSYSDLLQNIESSDAPYSVYSKEFNLRFLSLVPLNYFSRDEKKRFKMYVKKLKHFYTNIHDISIAEQYAMKEFTYDPKHVGLYSYMRNRHFVEDLIEAFEERIGHPVVVGYLFNGRNNKEDSYFVNYVSKIEHLETFRDFNEFMYYFYESRNKNLKSWYRIISSRVKETSPYAVKYYDKVNKVEFFRVPFFLKKNGIDEFTVIDVLPDESDLAVDVNIAGILKEKSIPASSVYISPSYEYGEAL